MRNWPAHLILALWVLWCLYWLVAARGAKPVRAREPLLQRSVFVLTIIIQAALLAGHHWPALLMHQVIPGGWIRYGFAVGLIVIGLGFSIWARAVLGSNWSGTVTVKVDHELVMTGPYRRVRHPIYTGILLAVLGTWLAAGQVRGLLAFLIALLALWLKSRVEERWMTREFGEQYGAYQRRTWALLPCVL